jgi:hypothetical protein
LGYLLAKEAMVVLLQVITAMVVVLLLQDLATAALHPQVAVDMVALHLLVTVVLLRLVGVMVVHLLRRAMVRRLLRDTEVQHQHSRRIITWHTVSVVAFSVPR